MQGLMRCSHLWDGAWGLFTQRSLTRMEGGEGEQRCLGPLGRGGVYLLCSCRGWAMVTCRTWVPVRVSLFPWIWKVRGLLPGALCRGRLASEASCAILTTSPAAERGRGQFPGGEGADTCCLPPHSLQRPLYSQGSRACMSGESSSLCCTALVAGKL